MVGDVAGVRHSAAATHAPADAPRPGCPCSRGVDVYFSSPAGEASPSAQRFCPPPGASCLGGRNAELLGGRRLLGAGRPLCSLGRRGSPRAILRPPSPALGALRVPSPAQRPGRSSTVAGPRTHLCLCLRPCQPPEVLGARSAGRCCLGSGLLCSTDPPRGGGLSLPSLCPRWPFTLAASPPCCQPTPGPSGRAGPGLQRGPRLSRAADPALFEEPVNDQPS